MSKFSLKPINSHNKKDVKGFDKKETGNKVVNKFKGMAEKLEFVEPVVIPGYKILG